MKWKQILFTVAISAVTTVCVIWSTGTFFGKSDTVSAKNLDEIQDRANPHKRSVKAKLRHALNRISQRSQR